MLTELQTDSKLVGLKQSLRAVESGKVKKVFLAMDSDDKVQIPIRKASEKANVEIEEVPTMAELGNACGINIGSSVAVILCD